MDKDHRDPYKLDLTKPRLAWYKQKTWKRHQCHLDHHRKFPSKIIGWKNWILILLEAAKTQRIEPKPKTQLSSLVRPVCGQESTKEIEKRTILDHDTLSQEKHDVTDSTSTDQNAQGVACWPLNMLKKIKQVREDPYWWIKKRSTKKENRVPAEEKKQNICEFKSLWKRSKLILIEKHFMPHCSRITSTTHSAKNGKRWSANWVMWSYSSCAKLYQKYIVLTVFSIGIKELPTIPPK